MSSLSSGSESYYSDSDSKAKIKKEIKESFTKFNMATTLTTSIEAFNKNVEDFETYVTRVKLYFIVNDVVDKKQVPLFLTLIGAETFTLAKNLLSPRQPELCKLDEIITELTNHFKPKTIQVYERYKFYNRNQKSNETIAEYVAELKALARTCEFEDSLELALRDKLVMGVSNKSTQRSFFTESGLTFQRAFDMATAKEAANRDMDNAKSLGMCSQSEQKEHQEVNSISFRRNNKFSNDRKFNNKPTNKSKSYNDSNSTSDRPKSKCSGCGNFHWKKDCPFLNAECFNCKKTGHLKKMCQNRSTKLIKSYNHDSNATTSAYDFVFNVSDKRVPPIMMAVTLNNMKLDMEVDTGSFYSLMSERVFLKTWPISTERPQIRGVSNKLNVYGGSPLNVLGAINVNAFTDKMQQSIYTDIIVVKDDGPTLLGRGLMNALKIDKIDLSVNNISNVSNWELEFPNLFKPGLGCLQGKEFHIEVDPTVPPKFCKARTVPYTLRNKVNSELDRLVSEGIITPVSHSLWAAAVVPVLKSDDTIRVCGDYKLTVNRAARLDSYPIPRIQDLFSQLSIATVFSKLDMSQAYSQLCLDKVSK